MPQPLSLSLYSKSATSVSLHLHDTLPLTQTKPHLWEISIPYPDPDDTYLFVVDGRPVLDPYAKALSTPHTWGKWPHEPRCQFTFDHTFDWQDVKRPFLKKTDLVIYELHTRGFTKHPSSQVENPGTFLGIIEKLDHLKNLGINAIELMPIHEFDERDNPLINPKTGHRLWNYWGYMTTNFFAPMKRYATSEDRLAPLNEFKTLVRECHRNGIEVILDVVYNHVSLASSLEIIDKESYFILNPDKSHTNFSGCGNTLSVNESAAMDLVFSSLHYFAKECQVDGFRFDLAGCFIRGHDGSILPDPPFLERLYSDPVLSSCKLIFEPWDCFDANLLHGFPLQNCSVWNTSFKAATRRFMRGDAMQEQFFKDSFLGSSYLFQKGAPYTTNIHYVTSHDGFSLTDLVSYSSKHNASNGEHNRDGENENYASGYGAEGPHATPAILELRDRQRKNFFFANLLSFGIPMLRMGDEYGHTNNGNNNMYCHDEENWFLWDKPIEPLLQELIPLRKLPIYRHNPSDVDILFQKDHVSVFLIDKTYLVACNASHFPIHLPSQNGSILVSTNPEADLSFLPPNSCFFAKLSL